MLAWAKIQAGFERGDRNLPRLSNVNLAFFYLIKLIFQKSGKLKIHDLRKILHQQIANFKS